MRPILNLDIKPEEFLNFYWLKEELFTFCKQNNLPGSGSKDEITERIYQYLKTGKIIKPSRRKKVKNTTEDSPLSLHSKIPKGYKNDLQHRSFFKSQIGEHFKFNVPFMKWMKENHGKTYKDAISEWNRIVTEKKQGNKSKISSQFQYNQYTRDFFKANPDARRDDAIKCWKYKKSLPGHNKYEKEDLLALTKCFRDRQSHT